MISPSASAARICVDVGGISNDPQICCRKCDIRRRLRYRDSVKMEPPATFSTIAPGASTRDGLGVIGSTAGDCRTSLYAVKTRVSGVGPQ
jgi:hypothetical protein